MRVSEPGVTGVNHVTLACTDLARSVAFWRDAAGLRLVADWPRGAYLECGALWLCLSLQDAPLPPRTDYTHIALSCSDDAFDALAARLRAAAAPEWQPNRSPGRSVYFRDPDGHRFELHTGSLDARLAAWAESGTGAPPQGLRLHPR